ncbi:MAG: hypothetical protein U0166_22765 [Acidobacteriota bacterium]
MTPRGRGATVLWGLLAAALVKCGGSTPPPPAPTAAAKELPPKAALIEPVRWREVHAEVWAEDFDALELKGRRDKPNQIAWATRVLALPPESFFSLVDKPIPD